ncbi:MAG: hypothetical protein JRI43_01425 [Deltaproteobacteria bacterium]|nr:hypothetical protein [Deltaproteobacteria bacterium]MBW1911831.1 hypothetical protein [Deltaproteobacteria bacterium]
MPKIIHENSIYISRVSEKSNQLILAGHGAYKTKKGRYFWEKDRAKTVDIPDLATIYFYTKHGQPQKGQDQAEEILKSASGYIGGFQGKVSEAEIHLSKKARIAAEKMYIENLKFKLKGKYKKEIHFTEEGFIKWYKKKHKVAGKKVIPGIQSLDKGKTTNYYLWPHDRHSDIKKLERLLKDHQKGRLSRLVDICIIKPSSWQYGVFDLGRSLSQIFDLIKKEIKPLYKTYHWSACRTEYGVEMARKRKFEKSEES